MHTKNDDYIFISYSRKDYGFVNKFVKRLREKGLKVWLDTSGSEHGIPSAVKWREFIIAAVSRASGAIRVISQNNNDKFASKVCKWEMDLILDRSMPYKEIEAIDTLNDHKAINLLDEYVSEIEKWNQEVLHSSENDIRTYLYSQGYLFSKDKKISHFVSRSKGTGASFKYLRFLKECKSFFKEECFYEKDPETGNEILRFLNRAKRYTVITQILKLSLAALIVLCFIFVFIITNTLPTKLKDSESSYRFYAASKKILDTMRYDPIAAGTFLTDEQYKDYYTFSDYFTVMQQLAVKLIEIHYPVGFFRAGTEEAENIKSLPSAKDEEKYSIHASSETGALWISNLSTGKEYRIDLIGVPTIYSFVPGKDKLIIAVSNKLFIYDLDNTMKPIELSYNFEDIVDFRFIENTIYAITDAGNVVSWVDPIPEKKIKRELESAKILDGNHSAVYLTDNSVLINNDNKETEINLPFSGIDKEIFDVTKDGTKVLLNYKKDNYSTVVCICNISSAGEIEEEFVLEENINAISFSADETKILALTDRGLYYKSTDDDSAQFFDLSNELRQSYAWSVKPYNDSYIISTSNGDVAIFDSRFARKSDWVNIQDLPVPLKDISVAEGKRYIFTANIGGNNVFYCARYDISTGAVNNLPVEYNRDMSSNTAVGLSNDENAVVYGYPNGEIAVYDTETLNLLYKNHTIAEPVVATTISDDKSMILAIGRSGTLYRIDTMGLIESVNLEEPEEYWQKYVIKLKENHKKMYDLGLTYIYAE